MPRKKRTIIDEVVSDSEGAEGSKNGAAEPDAARSPRLEQQEREFYDLMDNLGEGPLRIKVYKQMRTGSFGYCGQTTDIGILTEDYLLSTWGSGIYHIKIFGRHPDSGKVQLVTSRKVEIFGIEDKPVNAVSGANITGSAQTIAQPGYSDNTQYELLREQINRQHEMLLHMLENKVGREQGSTFGEVAAAMATLKNVVTTPNSGNVNPLAMVSELIGVFQKGIEIGASGKVGGDGWLGIAHDVLGMLPNVIKGFKGQATMTANSTIQNTEAATQVSGSADFRPEISEIIPGLIPELIGPLKEGVAYLKKKVQLGKQPDLWIELIIDSLEEQHWNALVQLTARPIEQTLGVIDPEINNPPYREWFERLFIGIRNALRDISDANGQQSDGVHAMENAGVSAEIPK